jgi:hypothetical protein
MKPYTAGGMNMALNTALCMLTCCLTLVTPTNCHIDNREGQPGLGLLALAGRTLGMWRVNCNDIDNYNKLVILN